MNKENNIKEKTEAALNSLEGMRSASPGAFFFTRVQARLNRVEKNVWETLSGFIARPAVAIAVVCLVVLMNAVAVLQEEQTSPSLADQSEQSNFDDFELASNAYYDYEIKEP